MALTNIRPVPVKISLKSGNLAAGDARAMKAKRAEFVADNPFLRVTEMNENNSSFPAWILGIVMLAAGFGAGASISMLTDDSPAQLLEAQTALQDIEKKLATKEVDFSRLTGELVELKKSALALEAELKALEVKYPNKTSTRREDLLESRLAMAREENKRLAKSLSDALDGNPEGLHITIEEAIEMWSGKGWEIISNEPNKPDDDNPKLITFVSKTTDNPDAISGVVAVGEPGKHVEQLVFTVVIPKGLEADLLWPLLAIPVDQAAKFSPWSSTELEFWAGVTIAEQLRGEKRVPIVHEKIRLAGAVNDGIFFVTISTTNPGEKSQTWNDWLARHKREIAEVTRKNKSPTDRNAVRISNAYDSDVAWLLPTLKIRVTERRDDGDQTHAWQLDLENVGSDTISPTVELRWVDKDGFVLDYCYGCIGKKIEPGHTRHFAGTFRLDASHVKRFKQVTMDITD